MYTSSDHHISKNRLEGNLGDTPLQRLLDECRKHLVTGTIWVRPPGKLGCIELRAGGVEKVEFEDKRDDEAIAAIEQLTDGEYELVQRLPEISGGLGRAARAEGNVSDVNVVKLMNLCETNALSCSIIVINDFDRGELVYRAGELAEVTFNGHPNDDAIVELVRLTDARFRVEAPPLDLNIEGWPSVRRAPTVPFRIDGEPEDVERPKRFARATEPPDEDVEPRPRRHPLVRALGWIASTAAFGGAGFGAYQLGLWIAANYV